MSLLSIDRSQTNLSVCHTGHDTSVVTTLPPFSSSRRHHPPHVFHCRPPAQHPVSLARRHPTPVRGTSLVTHVSPSHTLLTVYPGRSDPATSNAPDHPPRTPTGLNRKKGRTARRHDSHRTSPVRPPRLPLCPSGGDRFRDSRATSTPWAPQRTRDVQETPSDR